MRGVYLKKGNVRVSVVPYYRIGDLFLTTIATNPSGYLGGQWELFGPGRCLVCVDTSDSNFNTVKKTGGANTKSYRPAGIVEGHTLTNEELPEMVTVRDNVSNGYGNQNWSGPLNGWGNYQNNRRGYTVNLPHSHGFTGTASNINVIQKYITCYVWIRTA